MRSAWAAAVCLLSLVHGSVVAWAGEPDQGPVSVVVVEDVPGTGSEQAPAILNLGGEILALYINPEGRIAFRRGSAGAKTLDDDTERPGGKHVRLHYDGTNLYALWWQKLSKNGGKHLHVRVSRDNGKTFDPVVILNSGLGVLPTYDIASDGDGGVAVAYHDERKPSYEIYLNRSKDGGKTWLEQDIRLDSAPFKDKEKKTPAPFAVEPKLLFQGGSLIATWKEKRADSDKKFRTVSRTSSDGGTKWGPEIEIRRDKRGFFTSEQLVSTGDAVILVGYSPDEGLIAYRSIDDGGSWEFLGVSPGTESASAVSQIEVLPSASDVLVSYTLEQQKKKSSVYVSILSLDGGTWHPKPFRLNRGTDGDDLTQARTPDLALLGEDTVVAVWEDYRDIRPNIYLDYTTDGGQTWQPNPLPLMEPGRTPIERPKLLGDDGRLLVMFDKFKDDVRQSRDHGYVEVPYEADSGIPVLPKFAEERSKAEKEQQLRERAEAFWKLRTEGKFGETYAFFDPIFRAQTSYDAFMAHQGNIVYDSFKVLDVGSWGNLADVVVRIGLHVPEMEIAGETFKQESREETMHSEWVWIHDNWYAVFRTAMGTRYLNY